MKGYRAFTRVSLRTAFLAITALCVLLAWHLGRTRLQKDAVCAIKQAGGSAYYAYQYDRNGNFITDARPPAPKWTVRVLGVDAISRVTKVCFEDGQDDYDIFQPLIRLPRIEHLNLNYTAVTDTGIANLRQLPRLKKLDLYHSKVTDAGLHHLSELRQLEELRIGEMQVTGTSFHHLRKLESLHTLTLSCSWVNNEGLKQLRHHPNLRRLHLYYSEVDDVGLGYLKDLPRLEFVSLGRMNVSDIGLKRLQECKNLQHLKINAGTRITPEGVKSFKQAIPGCRVQLR
jgi:hypothetical protein